jgi:hypothetical protein
MFTESLIFFISMIVSINNSGNTTQAKQVEVNGKVKASVEVVSPVVNERKCGGWDGN